MSNNIIIIDYGVGNLLSISQAVEKCGFKFSITSDEKTISQASHIILPGVGSFDKCITSLRELRIDKAMGHDCNTPPNTIRNIIIEYDIIIFL